MTAIVTDERKPGLDGLRALAVAAVMAFHAGRPWALGGYLGVDTFFVLSGFLITGLLLAERSRTGRISVRAFWGRRAQRIIPALILLVMVVLAIAAAQHTGALSTIRADAMAALGYIANWRFLIGHRGYFGQAAPTSLFEHTWSLSIEEQFYLLWPLVVVVLARTRRPRLAVGLFAAAGATASAVATVLLARGGASTSRLYFGTDTRVQAILIGAALAAWLGGRRAPSPRNNGTLHVLACGGIAITALLWWRLDGLSPGLFRGGTTAAALATAAIIPSVVLVPNGFVGRVLGIAPLRALGVISYGVYLWHWPVQLLLTGSATGWQGTPLLLLRVGVTLAAAGISYVIVEQPQRRRTARPVRRLLSFGAMAGATTVAAVVLVTVALTPATPLVAAAAPVSQLAPVPTSTTTSVTTAITIAPSTSVRPVVVRPARPAVTVAPFKAPTPVYRMEVLGDSVAESVAQGLAPVGSRYGLSVLDDSLLGCGVAPEGAYRLRGEIHDIASTCREWESLWTSKVRASHANVAVIQLGRHEALDTWTGDAWESVLDRRFAEAIVRGIDRAIEIAATAGGPVVLLTAPYYSTGEAPDGRPWPENDPQRVNRFNQLLRDAAARHPRTTVIDLGRRTNPAGHYASTVGGVRMRNDGVHYSKAACVWFAPWLAPQIRAVVGP